MNFADIRQADLERRLRTLEASNGGSPRSATQIANLLTPLVQNSPSVVTGFAGTNPGQNLQSITAATGTVLRIIGATTPASLASGVNTGTAGAGTSATSLAKPAAAANWTASNLFGKWLKITSGGGASTDGTPMLRPILSNTTTTAAVNGVSGMDSTTVFEVVTLTSLFDYASILATTAIKVAASIIPIEIYGCAFSAAHVLNSLIQLSDCVSVKVSGCEISINTAQPAVLVQRCQKALIEHCRLTGGGGIRLDTCLDATADGCVNSAGGMIELVDCLKATVTKLTSASAPSRVLSMTRCLTGFAEVTANGGGATPVYLESVSNFTSTGAAMLTGTGNTGYGLEIAKSGLYTLTGSSITGSSGDVNFMSSNTPWSILTGAGYGMVEEHAGSALANAAYSKAVKNGNYAFAGDINIGGRLLTFGYFNPSANTTTITLGANDVLDMERARIYNTATTLFTATGTESSRGCAIVNCTSATAKVMLPDGAAIGGAFCAIVNIGAQSATVVAPNTAYGSGANGTLYGAITTVAALTSRVYFSLCTSGGRDFMSPA